MDGKMQGLFQYVLVVVNYLGCLKEGGGVQMFKNGVVWLLAMFVYG